MSAVKLLLMTLAAVGCLAAPGPEDCDGLNITLSTHEMNLTYGDWVLFWSVGIEKNSSGLLSNLSSSHVHIRRLEDNKTVFEERNLFKDQSCTRYNINMTENTDKNLMDVVSATYEKNGKVSAYLDEAVGKFFRTNDPDFMRLLYEGMEGDFLLGYIREGLHQNLDRLKASYVHHEKLAECLSFPHDKTFTYDGEAGFCPKRAPEPRSN